MATRRKTERKKGQRPDGSFQHTVSAGKDSEGKRIRRVFYGRTAQEAKARADAYRAQIGQGYNPDAGKTTVKAWGDIWIDTYKQSLAPKTKEMYNSALKHINASMGNLTLEQVRPVHVQQLFNVLSGMSASTIKKVSGCMQQLFGAALENGMIQKSPLQGTTVPKGTKGTHRALAEWEIQLIIQHWHAYRAGLWAMLMLFAGVRKGEACALRWTDIDFEAKEINVTASLSWLSNQPETRTPKTAAGMRKIPIPPPLLTALQRTEPSGEYVCTSMDGNILTAIGFRRGWDGFIALLERAANNESLELNPGRRTDIEQKKAEKEKQLQEDNKEEKPRISVAFTPHDLRHTYATMLYDAGVDVKTAQRYLGHASAQMTMELYTHLSDNRALESKNAFEKFTKKYECQ